jgi:hypothetical protein
MTIDVICKRLERAPNVVDRPIGVVTGAPPDDLVRPALDPTQISLVSITCG